MAATTDDLWSADAIMKSRDTCQRFLVAIQVYVVLAVAGWVTMEPPAQAVIGIHQLSESSRPKLTPVEPVLEFFRVSELPRVPERTVSPPVS